MTLRAKWNTLDTLTQFFAVLWSGVFLVSLLACAGDDGHEHPEEWEERTEGDAGTLADGSFEGNAPMTCSDMTSCDDALHHYNQVSGDPYDWDEDDDGIPCERTVCGQPQCDIKRSCDDLDNCSEAFRHLNHCSNDWHGLDNNGDGVPCEEELCTDDSYECQIDRDCSDFDTYEEAQNALQSCSGDPHDIDQDDDGVACDNQKWSVDCNANYTSSYDCGDMSTCSMAKAWMNGCQTDRYNLDQTNNGVPCSGTLCTSDSQ